MPTFKKPAQREKLEKNDIAVPAEFCLIGAILNRPDLIEYVTHLTPEHFFDLFCSRAFGCAIDMHMRSVAIDLGSLHSEVSTKIFMNDEDLLDSLLNCQTWAGEIVVESMIKNYAKIVLDKSVERSLAAAAEPLNDIARNDGLTIEQKFEQSRQLYEDAAKKLSEPSKLISADEMIEMTLAQSRQTQLTGTLPGIPTGFAELDKMTSGFMPAELVIIAARPGVGKTAFALCLAHHAAAVDNRAILMISLEMNATQIGPRWISLISGVDMHPITNGKLTEIQERKISQAHQENVPFFVDETPGMTLSQICKRARMLHASTEGGLGMLIVDYLGLIKLSGRQGANLAELISGVTGGLKELSRELNIPVLLLSQLNRDVEKRQDKRPQSSDLRDSGAIEQDADLILLLYRDEVYNKHSVDAGLAEIIVAKQRRGEMGTIIVKFNGAQSRFHDHDATKSTTQLIKKFRETSNA